MPLTLLDLPLDVWEAVAAALPAPRDRFTLALACKRLWSALADCPVGGAWATLDLASRSDAVDDDVIARHAGALQSLHLTADRANVDAVVRLLTGTGARLHTLRVTCKLSKAEVEHVLAAVSTGCPAIRDVHVGDVAAAHRVADLVATNPAVRAMINRLHSLHLDYMPTAAFLKDATLTHLSFDHAFPRDLPTLPSIASLCLTPHSTLFDDADHAQRSARALPGLVCLRLRVGCDVRTADDFDFAAFLMRRERPLRRVEIVSETWHSGAAQRWIHALAPSRVVPSTDGAPTTTGLAELEVTTSSLDCFEQTLDVHVLLSHPLTRLVFKKSATAHPKIVVPLYISTWPTLRHLDLRGCTAATIGQRYPSRRRRGGGGGGVPLPRVPPGGLPSLHTLLLDGTDGDVSHAFDVAAFAAWDAAPRLAILVVERARLVASADAATVTAGLADHKPCLASVHLHGCVLACDDDDDAGAAVEALLRGRRRVCRRGRVGACLFGQETA